VTTPSVTYQYNAGSRTSISTSAVPSPAIPATARQNLSFDGLGRVPSSSQTTNGTTYTFSQYQYTLADGLTQMALPSGRTVMNGYDNAGRLCSVAGVASGATVPTPTNPCAVTPSATVTVYANSFQYSPNGATQSMARGDTLSENRAYNDRLETTSITVGPSMLPVFGLSLYYCPSKAATCATNNGNVVTATPASTGVDQTYGYTDGVNRLTSMQEGSNSQSWTYDNLGNRWVSGGSGLPQSSFMPSSSSGYNANNQLVTGSAAYGDGRGNQTAIGSYTFSYDAENRMTTGTNNGAAATYVYDGEGRRVSKNSGGITTVYVYDAFGNLAGEYGGAGTTPACTTCYLTTDQIGSTRLATNAAGTVVERHDYMPFGEELVAGAGGRTTAQGYPAGGGVGATSVIFTGQYRDAEDVSSAMPSGLDFFGARYFSSAQGRWTSPDWSPTPEAVPYADLTDPQTLNLYSYVRNNPLARADADGHCFWDVCIGETAAAIAAAGATATYLASPAGQKAIAATVALVNKTADAIGRGIDALNSAPSACGVSCTSEFYPGPGATSSLAFNQAAKSPPNPNGQQGAPDHQAEVQNQTDKAQAGAKPGETVLAGKKIQGVDSTRRPDVQVVGPDGKVVKVTEAERRPNSQRHIERQKEYDRLGVPHETVPLPKKNPGGN
jgi:RHS repeat-associated protein